MLVMSDEEMRAWQELQRSVAESGDKMGEQLLREHANFWNSQYHAPRRRTVKEWLSDFVEDYEVPLTILMTLVLMAVLVVCFVYQWPLALAVLLFVVGLVIYLVFCAARAIVAAIQDWLL